MRRALVALSLVGLLAACTSEGDPTVQADSAPGGASSTTGAPVAAAPTTSSTTTTSTTTTTTTIPTTTTAPPPPARLVTDTGYSPFATVGGITLLHPSARVEQIGFHESNNDGARHLDALPTATRPSVLESRARDTDGEGAADVVVDPDLEIRAPVTGTVVRAGTYTLYCEYSDDYVVIEPDDHPGWEVKILHINDEQVSSGERVVAGETVIAPNAHVLPFVSDVDEIRTADPAWPHTHIEVVDPTIPDRPTPGGCG